MTMEFFSLPRMSVSRIRKELCVCLGQSWFQIPDPDHWPRTLTYQEEQCGHDGTKQFTEIAVRSQEQGVVTRTKLLGEGRLDLRNDKFLPVGIRAANLKVLLKFFLPKFSVYQTSVSFRASPCTVSSYRCGIGLQLQYRQFFQYNFPEFFMQIKQKLHMYIPLFIHMVAYHIHCTEPCFGSLVFVFLLSNISLRLCYTSIQFPRSF